MLEAIMARSKVRFWHSSSSRISCSRVTSWKQLMAPTTGPSPSRSGPTLTRATQRFPSGFWTTASTPSKLSPASAARAIGVSSGGMNSPSRLSRWNEPQKFWGPSPQLDRPLVDPEDLAVGVARVNTDRQRIEDRLVQLQKGFQKGRRPDREVELKQGHGAPRRVAGAYQTACFRDQQEQ